ncbi:apolipoprotein N-acyltransferase [Deinococcus kurensis]|uniref:apolipoprotein N-acyltransferase n=1 Tax=Deinococcus kurensis TaxID=2662757 RepID=UPI001F2A0E51|nr:apolipoprotein N-acyltransferase [Deinococcus kurensis]
MVLGAVLGALYPPSALGWLAPVPLGLLFRATADSAPRRAFRITWITATAMFGVMLSWLPQSLGAMLGWEVSLLFPVLAALLGLGCAAAVVVTRWAAGRLTLGALPLVWVLLDALREMGPLAFPWGGLGYFLSETPLVQVAEWGGVSLLGLLVGAAASAVAAWSWRGLWVALLWVGALAFGVTRPLESVGTRPALLVQGAVDPRAKVQADADREWRRYLSLTREAGVTPGTLVVWPEGAVPWPPPEGVRVPAETAVLLGASVGGAAPRNAAFLVRGDTVVGRQDKVRLVPFGEFFPGQARWPGLYRAVFRSLGLPALVGRVPGEAVRPVTLGAFRVGVLICYESVFASQARALVAQGANVLVTPSNDAWFGASRGAEQHFRMGRVRAVETRRWWVRAGNDGITAVVDPRGQVWARLPRFIPGTLPVAFSEREVLTLSVRWPGWVVWAALALVISGLYMRKVVHIFRLAHW